jgi:protein phosphatase 2C family protein 2/3
MYLGSAVAKYTGESLHHRVRESDYFDKKEYAKALTDAYMKLDKELAEGIYIYMSKERRRECGIDRIYIYIDQSFICDPSGCTAITALIIPEEKAIYAVCKFYRVIREI